MRSSRCRAIGLALVVLLGLAPRAFAEERFALIVSGAPGGAEYAQKYTDWRTSFAAVLKTRFGYADDHVVLLGADEGAGVRKATRDNVRAALADLRQRVGKDDVLAILLIGHGTATDFEDAKFNLVGLDLTANEWADLVRPIAGRVVFIDAASASFPFLQKLAARGRVVITSTDSPAEQGDVLFPQFLLEALSGPEADLDKNGRVSMWEAFSYASRLLRDSFQQAGRLPTERPLLDDTGQGTGREAGSPGPDGALAMATYLEPENGSGTAPEEAQAALVKRRAEVVTAIERLKFNKSHLDPAAYDAAIEQMLLELSQIDRQLRNKS